MAESSGANDTCIKSISDPGDATSCSSPDDLDIEAPIDPQEGGGGLEGVALPNPVPRTWFQFRLWMLLLLFVPFAFLFKGYGDVPAVSYTEERDLFWQDGMTHLDFLADPDGVPLGRGSQIDSLFEGIGVTFAYGLPLRKPESETEPGLIQASHLTPENQASGNPGVPKGSPLRNEYLSDDKAKTEKKSGWSLFPKPKQKPMTGFIGVSGYPFKFAPPGANYRNSIAVFENIGSYTKRFRGSMTIRFHKPGKPSEIAGVHKIGFYAARLNHAEAIEVRLYTLDGTLMCRQANIEHRPCAFMSFTSTLPISRIEIETIGMDKDYAIAGLMFDKVRVPLAPIGEPKPAAKSTLASQQNAKSK